MITNYCVPTQAFSPAATGVSQTGYSTNPVNTHASDQFSPSAPQAMANPKFGFCDPVTGSIALLLGVGKFILLPLAFAGGCLKLFCGCTGVGILGAGAFAAFKIFSKGK